ncbi:MAG: Molybdopterin synthase catalytic subunit MoaE [uncultured Sphingomonadaceae bacterium]|uniref:Molybdopterin synthase catalytic subunit n=1 Tax=uncultured Sphingomonadaceae bacterium TaxID=169976 RepID=A0A6J4T5U2_9SPHN|nr:MAG: Molybdopterin synthase catalytic subunit MoaE [uncultured Sphingomonadaceae bacterium]
MIRVQAEPFDPGVELAALAAEAAGAGGIASFVGLVRARSDDATVARLELIHYPGFTERTIAAIAEDARWRFPVRGVRIVHRHGPLAPGEPIVFVAAAAEHRRAAFDAVDYLMDRLKTEAPFWKREHGPVGERWIEARDADRADRARWEEG